MDRGNDRGETPVFLAAQGNCVEALDVLLRHGADANKPNKEGVSPAVAAVATNSLEALRVLLAAKADVSGRAGERAASLATEKRHIDCLLLLLQAKAQPIAGK